MPLPSPKSSLFFAKIPSQGFVIKTICELLTSVFSSTDVTFFLTENGIFSSCNDEAKTTLIDINIKRKYLLDYTCNKEMNITFRTKTMLSHIKEVKKKDTLILFISKERPSDLGMQVLPNNYEDTNNATISYIKFYVRKNIKRFNVTEDTYDHPKVLKSTEFQRTCKQINAIKAKTVTIRQQNSAYISFLMGDDDISTKEIGFGFYDESEESKRNEYCQDFNAEHLTQLSKICQMTSSIQISYCLKYCETGLPIRIRSDAGNIGEIKIFVKDKTQIALENNIHLQNETDKMKNIAL